MRLSEKQKIGILNRFYQQQFGTDMLDPYPELKTLPFWCGNMELHIERPETYISENCCFTHRVGLPSHPAKGEIGVIPFQNEFFKKVDEHKQKWHKIRARKFHLNKGRQMGFTEFVLRIIQYYCFRDYAGMRIGIQAGTNGALARRDLRRFARLFKHIPYALKGPLKGNTLELWNDTEIIAFKATEEAMTGWEGFAAIFMDESAKWRMSDDQPVFNSILPIVENNRSDLFLVSTPKGRSKMFYDISQNPGDYIMCEYDIWNTEGYFYTKPEIEHLLEICKEDPNQEYLCEFVAGKSSIFGSMDKHISVHNEIVYDDELDEYDEPMDDDPRLISKEHYEIEL